MKWNYRVLAHENNGEIYFQMHIVYYAVNGNPTHYSIQPVTVGSESIKDIVWMLNKMLAGRLKPILWAGNKFPQEYNK